jgi:hypothetical protein
MDSLLSNFLKDPLFSWKVSIKSKTPMVLIRYDVKMEIPHLYIGQDAFKETDYLAGRFNWF